MSEAKATITDLTEYRAADYKQRQKLARAAVIQFYQAPRGKSASGDITVCRLNLGRLRIHLKYGILGHTEAERAIERVTDDLTNAVKRVRRLEREPKKTGPKLKRGTR